ncbi:DUF2953 domain-containing protein [Paenibacillus sp. P96]|uniref:DUF2953 domain-containing protein n=1 Tax=Paenibacillus zeirhizosphaerae TaxID=2987519 RepID=A0ABT9FPN2_9BACL|nr:DUF2953 domain-containing protein [Paenibacillus sp. P96]MDP4096689.1 DUF2953 domain-containing protein [Paenibacillus sp. P96]
MWIWIVIAAFVLLLAVLLSKVNIHAEVLKQAHNDYARVQVHMLYGLIRFKYEMPSVMMEGLRKGVLVRLEKYANVGKDKEDKEDTVVDKDKVKQIVDNLRLLIENSVSLKEWGKTTVAHVTLSHLKWTTKLGLKDCSQTAVLTGVAWAVKSVVVGWTTGLVRYSCVPALSVTPSWEQRNYFFTNVVCSASISLAYVVFSLLRLLASILKVQGGLAVWKAVFTGQDKSKA